MGRFLVECTEAPLPSAGGLTIRPGSAISWMEKGRHRHREHAVVVSIGQARDYRAPVSLGDTTRKDYGNAGICEGTVIHLARNKKDWFRIRLDKDDDGDVTDEEDLTEYELMQITRALAVTFSSRSRGARPGQALGSRRG